MFRSIRWTLLLWQAAILSAALLLFGVALDLGASHGRRHALDDELESAARAVVARLLTPPTTRPAWATLLRRPPPPEPAHGLPPDWAGKIPPDFLNRRGTPGDDQLYFAVAADDGTVVCHSTRLPPVRVSRPPATAAGRPDPVTLRTIGGDRQVLLTTPPGATVLVGRPTARLDRDIAALRWTLLAAGGVVLAVGLAGGWVLATRATAPIRAMGTAAAGMAAADPAADPPRLPVPPDGSELAPLARTLNDAFDALRAAYDRQARFTADASHELRTPLAVMRSQADLALRRPRSPDEYRAALDACRRAATRMADLVDSLLLIAAADAGRPGGTARPVDLAAVVRDAVVALAPLADERHVTCHVDAPSLCTVVGDADAIARVLSNVLGNAIKYNRDGGDVRVTVAPAPANTVRLTVADTGVGIPAADLPRLFERFYRPDAARSRATGGSGLGLAICRAIVRSHGGTIAIASDGPDRGTTVTVDLPAA